MPENTDQVQAALAWLEMWHVRFERPDCIDQVVPFIADLAAIRAVLRKLEEKP
jgi:hypothetical protein